jgi:GT2 family glycosyltransferase
VSANPKVFVVTLNWNGKKWLGDCLSSILAMDYPNFEVVVVDNGSTDGSVEFVHEQFPQIHVVELGSNLGYARGFNAGLEYAAKSGAEYFLIMNNDTVIDRGALSALVETASKYDRAGFVTGKVYLYDHPSMLQSVGKEEDPIVWSGNLIGFMEEDKGQYDEVAERIFIDDVFTLVSRSLYDEVGGYDPQYYLQAEEFDWQVRARKKGWKFYYTPYAKVWHRVSMSMGGIGNSVGRYFDTRSCMVVMARHAKFFKFTKYYFYTGYKVTNSLLRGLAQLDMSKIRPRLAMWLGFVTGTFWLVHRRPSTRVPWFINKLVN